MKKYCFLLISMLCMAACKKTPVTPLSAYSYSFVANTFQFMGNTYTATYGPDSVTGKLTFNAQFYEGQPFDSQYVRLTFSGNGYIDTGAYSNIGALAYNDAGYIYAEDYGTYQITKLDTAKHLISGTFQFRGNCSLQQVLFENINNGVFTNIQYTTP